MFVFGKHTGGLNTNCLAYSPDGRLLVSAKTGIKVWDFQTRAELREIPTLGDASSVDFAPNGWIVVANGARHAAVQFYDPFSGELKSEFPGACKLQCAHLTDHGETLVVAGHDHKNDPSFDKTFDIVRWNINNRRMLKPLTGHTEEVGFVAFHPQHSLLASGNSEGEAILWELRTRKPILRMTHRAKSWRIVAFSPDGELLAVTGGSTIELWHCLELKRKKILRGHKGTVHGIRFAPRGSTLLSVSEDGCVKYWDAHAGQEVRTIDWQLGPLNNLAISPDGLTAAAGSSRGQILVWDLDLD